MYNPEIGFWGGMALLVSSITGPGLTTVPLIFQQAGWLLPALTFLVVGTLSGFASLFLVEAMSHIRGNEQFQGGVEFTTIAVLCLGHKSHYVLQAILFLALQSVSISSIIISCQSMDTILIQLFHKTCAISFTQGWVCETTVNQTSGSPFTSYIFMSFGYLISVVLVLPLSVLKLGQNIIVQLISAATLICIFIIWVAVFIRHGLTNPVVVVGSDASQLVGFVVSNFAFVTTVPSFVNELSRKVSIHKTIIFPVIFCTVLYIVLGILGAASYHIDNTSNILATISSSHQGEALRVLSVIINVLFPLSVLVTSIPIFSIVIRYNLIRGNICSRRIIFHCIADPRAGAVLGGLLPMDFSDSFSNDGTTSNDAADDKGWLNIIVNWGSLLFASLANFVIPFFLYFVSKRYRALSLPGATEGNYFLTLLIVDMSGGRDLPLQSLHSSHRADSVERSPSETHPQFHVTAPPPASIIITNVDEPLSDFSEELNDIKLNEPGPANQDNLSIKSLRIDTSVVSASYAVEADGQPRASAGLTPIDTSKDLFDRQSLPGSQIKRRRGHSRGEDSIVSERSPVLEAEPVSMPEDEDESYPDQNGVRSSHHSVRSEAQVSILSRRGSGHSRSNTESQSSTEALFHAIPETKWFRSVTFAIVGFVVMTVLVLGNLIYTYESVSNQANL